MEGQGGSRDAPAARFTREDRQNLDALYSAGRFSPLWTDAAGRPNDDAGEALALLCAAFAHGLDPADYWAESLERKAAWLDAGWATVNEAARFDAALSAAMLRYYRDLHLGRVSPRDIGFHLDAPAHRHDFVAILRTAVASHRIRQTTEALAPQATQYRALQMQLERYRALASGAIPSSLEPVGVLHWRVRQLELALERLRWLPDIGPDERVIVLNIPMFRLWGLNAADQPPAFGMDAIVGRAVSTRTPVLVKQMREVVFRPYWNVPPSILKTEILPRIQRGPKYLVDENLEIVRGDGADGPVGWSAEALAGLRSGVLRVRQRPGAGNALGLVKFAFPNDQSIYLHGTPDQALFAKDRRDFSHGCVRVADPAALAEWVLAEDPGWTHDRIESAMKGSAELRVPLIRPITVILFYTTAMVAPEDGTLHFAQDIYQHDARLDRALKARR